MAKEIPMRYTKSYIDIYVKDFPVGKLLKCHLWLEGYFNNEQVTNLLNENLSLDEKFKDKYHISGFQIKYSVSYAAKDKDTKLGLIYIIKEVDYKKNETSNNMSVFNNKGMLKGLTIDNISKPKVNLKDINLKEYSDNELVNLKRRMVEEFFKREHKLSEDEYKFYLANIEEIPANSEDIKKAFEESKGDKFKFKKQKIRKKLFPLKEEIE